MVDVANSGSCNGGIIEEFRKTIFGEIVRAVEVVLKLDSGDDAFKVLVLWDMFCWMFFGLLVLASGEGPTTHPAEVTALRSIKESLIDPHRNLSNWNRGDPCQSNWTGVLCFNSTMDDGCLHVRELQLLNMHLSGNLSPELGRFSYMEILDVMWNNISGSIPKEIGNITSLELLLVNGNQLTGSLPEEIGYLPNLNRIQIDQNQISGPVPKSFANLNKTKHFHMNNNSLSGQIPPEMARLPGVYHLLFDNNNLSGYLPPELGSLSTLLVLQLDNNHHLKGSIPDTYANMHSLVKMSLRNCSLQGSVPDLSRMQNLTYIDLSLNSLNGSIPPYQLSTNVTTIDLSKNNLTGTVPSNFSYLPRLQRLSLENNSLSGSVESSIWKTRTDNVKKLIVDMQNNMLTNISGSTDLPPNVTVRLQGNPMCSKTNLLQFCRYPSKSVSTTQKLKNSDNNCPIQACPPPYEYSPNSHIPCLCSAPLHVVWRLKSPGFSDFLPYENSFDSYLTSDLNLNINQLDTSNFIWEVGPRLRMNLKFFPLNTDINSSYIFNKSEVLRIRTKFTDWKIYYSHLFGPYELLNFTLWGPYQDVIPSSSKSSISKGAVVGIVLGTVAGGILLSAMMSLLISRFHSRKRHGKMKGHPLLSRAVKIDGVKSFSYQEMAHATKQFDASSQIGEGGYGKVYRGILNDGTIVAIKRAQEGSLQGESEFLNEIELLSRLHHRNLVSLVGYCDDEGEQMLIYEFMSNGTLREHLSAKTKEPLSFAMRLRIALGSAKGINYLHTEIDPPIFHRDIKATNILLDSKYIAKVADFGLSRIAPIPNTQGIIPSYVSTAVKGTPGYLDPEYFLTQKLTAKSDVYSLGVVFLELLTGLNPISHGKSIVREVNIAYESGKIISIIDDKMGSYPSECVEKFVSLALKCCLEETDARPSMAEVVRELEIIWTMMPDSDTKITGSSLAPPSSSSSSSQTNNPYVDMSGSDLVSGVVPTINPR